MSNITVRVPKALNLEQSMKVLESVLGKAGCPHCYSGLNISFENAVDPAERLFVVENEGQKIMEF